MRTAKVVFQFAACAGALLCAHVTSAPPGVADPTFGDSGIVTTSIQSFTSSPSLLVQPDARLIVVGASYSLGQKQFSPTLARYTADGALDPTFGTGGVAITPFGAPYSQTPNTTGVLLPDGRIVVGFSPWDGKKFYMSLLRYQPNGALDPAFGANGPPSCQSVRPTASSCRGPH